MPDEFYSSKEWRALRAQTKAKAKRANRPCAYCGKPIDWHTPGAKVSVDHVLNRKQRPDLALEATNLQVLHHACNTRKAAYVENNNRPEIGVDGFPTNSEWN